MDVEETKLITDWVRTYAGDYLSDVSPGLVTDAELSRAVRFRWFKLGLKGAIYKVGLNLHYGGNFGGMWITNKDDETIEFHPHSAPSHNLPTKLRDALRDYLKESDDDQISSLYHKTL